MARTDAERQRDNQIINLLNNIWNELKKMNNNLKENKDAAK